MLKLKKEELLNNEAVKKIQFDNDWYFNVEDVAKAINEDLSNVETITLPIGGEYIKTATLENIEKGRKQEELSEFNKALLKMRNKK
ncbi:hypothetical protein [Flavobacterium cerinum]|uniref:Uncharacterized protein n=1 Tax=Flavobacterium cerinum TaxID=2502784 RepID=A0A3S3SFD5_9FLAO|nr:hypothetical protein [Flavobacterium cerinum]RWX00991.1 hypothetical protein EPI11_08190 [Flavobacterium cerinum]